MVASRCLNSSWLEWLSAWQNITKASYDKWINAEQVEPLGNIWNCLSKAWVKHHLEQWNHYCAEENISNREAVATNPLLSVQPLVKNSDLILYFGDTLVVLIHVGGVKTPQLTYDFVMRVKKGSLAPSNPFVNLGMVMSVDTNQS